MGNVVKFEALDGDASGRSEQLDGIQPLQTMLVATVLSVGTMMSLVSL